MVDAATNTTETYVWNADGTLASFPGPGYTRRLEYDEEGRLVRIRRDYGGGNVQLAYEYGYGFDGGRRWRKDYVNGVWTRYPCGVACGAGELVEQQKPLEGGSWTVSALYLQGISLVRRNSEWHHFDPLGTAGVITNGSAQVVSHSLYDLFGVLRYEQGSAQTPWRLEAAFTDAEQLLNAGKGMLIVPRVANATRGFSWRWPPFRLPPWLRPPKVPPGVWFGVCGVSCVYLLVDVLSNFYGTCANVGSGSARLHCAVCTTWRQGGGMQLVLQTCVGCLCGVFGGGLLGGFACGALLVPGIMEILCASYPKPEEPPHYYIIPYPVPYPVPAPVPKPPSGPMVI